MRTDMGSPLQRKIKQNASFKSKAHEATLSLLVAGIHLRRESDAIFKKYGLSFSYYNVLRILRGAPEEGYPRCDIIDRMLDPAPDVTRLIDQMIKKGWVKRTRSASDRRVSLHWITQKGLGLLELIDNEVNELNAQYDAKIDDADLEHLIRICSYIYSDTSAAPAKDDC